MPQSAGTQAYNGGSCQRGMGQLKLQDQVTHGVAGVGGGVGCSSFSKFNVKRALEGGGEESW